MSSKYASPKNIKQLFRLFHLYGKNYVSVAKKIGSKKLLNVRNKELIKYYEIYQSTLLDYTAYLWMGFFLLHSSYNDKAKKLLEEKGIQNGEIMTALFWPIKRASILALQDKLGLFKEKDKKLSSREIQKIV